MGGRDGRADDEGVPRPASASGEIGGHHGLPVPGQHRVARTEQHRDEHGEQPDPDRGLGPDQVAEPCGPPLPAAGSAGRSRTAAAGSRRRPTTRRRAPPTPRRCGRREARTAGRRGTRAARRSPTSPGRSSSSRAGRRRGPPPRASRSGPVGKPSSKTSAAVPVRSTSAVLSHVVRNVGSPASPGTTSIVPAPATSVRRRVVDGQPERGHDLGAVAGGGLLELLLRQVAVAVDVDARSLLRGRDLRGVDHRGDGHAVRARAPRCRGG